MPVTEQEIRRLGDYVGATPAPADFDAFWSKRMAEADRVPLDFAVTPSEIPPFHTCEYLDLWFRGMGGAQLYAKYVKPRAARPVPLVLQFHGYPGASRSWLEQSSFAGMGCALLAMDCPGQGGNGQDLGGFAGTTVTGHIVAGLDGPVEEMYYVRLHQNIRILCRIVRELVGIDQSKVFVNGASQGGGLGLACAALNPGLVNRAAILYPFLSDYRLVWELGADLIAYEGLRYYSRWFDPDGTRQDVYPMRACATTPAGLTRTGRGRTSGLPSWVTLIAKTLPIWFAVPSSSAQGWPTKCAHPRPSAPSIIT